MWDECSSAELYCYCILKFLLVLIFWTVIVVAFLTDYCYWFMWNIIQINCFAKMLVMQFVWRVQYWLMLVSNKKHLQSLLLTDAVCMKWMENTKKTRPGSERSQGKVKPRVWGNRHTRNPDRRRSHQGTEIHSRAAAKSRQLQQKKVREPQTISRQSKSSLVTGQKTKLGTTLGK